MQVIIIFLIVAALIFFGYNQGKESPQDPRARPKIEGEAGQGGILDRLITPQGPDRLSNTDRKELESLIDQVSK